MNEKNPPPISDAELERLVKTTLKSTILTDEEVEEIVDSPQLWWRLQSRIAAEKNVQTRQFFIWNWQTAIGGAFLFLFVTGAAFWFSDSSKQELAAAATNGKRISVSAENFALSETTPETVSPVSDAAATKDFPSARRKNLTVKINKNPLKANVLRAETAPRQQAKAKITRSPKVETATEFIALSYLPASESGQIVRVKVPRSMMVSLGVSNDVERGKEMINAEVVVGDDGAARAIRFLNE